MSYMLHNLITGTVMAFPMKLALQEAWMSFIGREYPDRSDYHFELLNITGKDTYSAWPVSIERNASRSLRPWMVLDENGRPVDIRNWDWSDVKLDKSFSRYRNNGSKPHVRKIYTPRMIHATRKEHAALKEENRQLMTDGHMRIKSTHGKRMHQYIREPEYCERSWKASCKAGKQWAKHRRHRDPQSPHVFRYAGRFRSCKLINHNSRIKSEE